MIQTGIHEGLIVQALSEEAHMIEAREQTIPVLDLTDFQDLGRQARFVEAMGEALRDIGFFALTHHGVDPDLIRSAYAVTEAFFLLPDEVKARYDGSQQRGQRGFTAFGREHAKGYPHPDLKEFWHVGRDPDPGHPDSYLKNVWPAEVPHFAAVMRRLFQQLDACATTLLEACALYLGEPRQLLSAMTQDGDTILRVIHYPPVPLGTDPARVRSAAHEDINFITLLCEATAEGLELLQRDGSWLPIRAVPGQIIVDTGDMLQQLTNGLLRSTTHRVINPNNDRERRFSMPFFVHPRHEVDLTPLPSCIARSGGQPRFPSLTAGQYLEQRLKEIGLAS